MGENRILRNQGRVEFFVIHGGNVAELGHFGRSRGREQKKI